MGPALYVRPTNLEAAHDMDAISKIVQKVVKVSENIWFTDLVRIFFEKGS